MSRELSVLVVFSLINLAAYWGFGAESSPAKPNIVVIFTDDHGYADLGCQGSVGDVKTPNIDRMAREGVRMTDGYVTAPQCVPSRAGLISGRYQQRFGVDANGLGPLPLGVETLPARLAKAGYATGMVGKWHLEPNPTDLEWLREKMPAAKAARRRQNVQIPSDLRAPYLPGARGFQDYFVGNMDPFLANYDLAGESLAGEGKTLRTGMYRLDAQSEAAIRFIRRHKSESFFLYLAYFAPHVPLEATERYLNRFPGDMPTRRCYALAMISAIDDGVGRILDELLQSGIDENTLLFFIADNGAPLKVHKEDLPIEDRSGAWDGSLNDPWVGEKGMLTEGGIRVPFLVRWKGTLPEGLVYRQPVISLDVAATAMAAAGQARPAELDGVDLVPYLIGEKQTSPHDVLYWRFWNQAAVRSGQWKYLRLTDGTEYLFDLSSPEHEKLNRIGENGPTANELRKRLEQWASDLQHPGLPEGPLNSQEEGWYRHFSGWQNTIGEN